MEAGVGLFSADSRRSKTFCDWTYRGGRSRLEVVPGE
jgi:hypothetical protein